MLTRHAFASRALGEELRYSVYRSDRASAALGPLPVIYLLHGRGDCADSWEQALGDLEQLAPMIAVMPDAPWNSRASYYVDSLHRDGRAVETAFVRDLVEHVDATLPTFPSREGRAVAGYSMGGYGALRLGFAHPSLFGAVIALSPAVYDPEPPDGSSAREHGAFGRGELAFDPTRYSELGYPALLAGYPSDLPLEVVLAVGDAEEAHPGASPDLGLAQQTALLAERATSVAGLRVSFREYPGGHDFGVWRPALRDSLKRLALFAGGQRTAR
ncbi:alpha/beta hydrolase [Leifsonia poae]|uniref:alpha/beta hydrolase n=1 Tax=Leifsonia poae TaxID=110933 RepID=UPI003D66C000